MQKLFTKAIKLYVPLQYGIYLKGIHPFISNCIRVSKVLFTAYLFYLFIQDYTEGWACKRTTPLHSTYIIQHT